MACNKCNLVKCGCKDSYLTTPPPCPDPGDCPEVQPCAEAFDAQCVFYTGADITCGEDTVAESNSSVSDMINSVVNYFCNQDTIDTDILCGTDVVVQAGSKVEVAITRIVEYFCDAVDLCSSPLTETPTDKNLILCNDGNTETIPYNTFFETIENDLALPASMSYGLFAQTADSTPVVDPLPGSLIGTGVGSLTIDPLTYTWAAGDSFIVRAAGLITCSNTQELTISVRDGNGNTLATTGLIDLKTATANDWNLEITFTLRSPSPGPGTGTTGEMVSAGMFTYIPDAAGQAFEGSDFSQVTNTIDTFAVNTLEIIASFNLDESGANSIYSELLTLTKIY